MNKLSQISLLLLTLVLSFSAMSQADAGVVDQTAEMHQTDKNEASSHYPSSQPNPFGIHDQGEHGLNLIDQLSEPDATGDSQDDTFGHLLCEKIRQKHASIYLSLSKQIDPGLTVKKLIFPFHSHL